jgi:hypothetical protein
MLGSEPLDDIITALEASEQAVVNMITPVVPLPSAASPSPSPAPQQPQKKGRGRPKKSLEAPPTAKEQKNLTWDAKMEKTLLYLRFEKMLDVFNKSGNNTETSAAWNRLALELSSVCGNLVSKEQAMYKFGYLQKAYRETSAKLLSETGNRDESIVVPENWTYMNECFRKHSGAAAVDLGQSNSARPSLPNSTMNMFASSDFMEPSSDDFEATSGRQKKKPRADFNDSVELMAKAMAKIADSACSSNDTHQLEERLASKVTAQIDKSLQENLMGIFKNCADKFFEEMSARNNSKAD